MLDSYFLAALLPQSSIKDSFAVPPLQHFPVLCCLAFSDNKANSVLCFHFQTVGGVLAPLALPGGEKACHPQPSIDHCLQRLQPWPADHMTSTLGTKRIVEMIAIDMQLLSVVEDVGFRHVIQAFAPCIMPPGNTLPHVFHDVKDAVQNLVDAEPLIALTVNIWTTKCATQSFFGLTAH
jgi:hypothetical protein